MALYHLHGKLIQRSNGQSAVASAAYRSGERLHDKRLNQAFDYTIKSDVDESVILGPAGTPPWLFDREILWNTVEAAERLNGQPARDFDIALPIELVRADPEAAKFLLRRWAIDMFVAHRLMVDISFHGMRTRNPHAHLLATTRPVVDFACEYAAGSKHVFGKKARHLNDRDFMQLWRETWAASANAVMAEHGIDARIDHRTLAEQGIDRDPQIHVGPNASAMWKRGLQPDLKRKNIRITRRNLRKAKVWESIDPDADWSPLPAHEQLMEDAVIEGLPVFQDHNGLWVVLDPLRPIRGNEAEVCSPEATDEQDSIDEDHGLHPDMALAEDRPTAAPPRDWEAEYLREIEWYESIARYSAWLDEDLARERAEQEEMQRIRTRGPDVADLAARLERSFAANVQRANLRNDLAARRIDLVMESSVTGASRSLEDASGRATEALSPHLGEAFDRPSQAGDGLINGEPDPSFAKKLAAATDVAKAVGDTILEDARLIAISAAAVLGRGVQGATRRILSFTEGLGAAALRLFGEDADADLKPAQADEVPMPKPAPSTEIEAVGLADDDIVFIRLRDFHPVPFRRENDRWVLDDSRLDPWLKSRITNHIDDPLVVAEVERAVAARTNQLLLQLGSSTVPLLVRHGNCVEILSDNVARVAPGLEAHVHHLIEHDPLVQQYATYALQRWAARDAEPSTSSAYEAERSSGKEKTAADLAQSATRSTSSPDEDYELRRQQIEAMNRRNGRLER